MEYEPKNEVEKEAYENIEIGDEEEKFIGIDCPNPECNASFLFSEEEEEVKCPSCKKIYNK